MSSYAAPKCRHWKPYTGPRSPSSRWPRPAAAGGKGGEASARDVQPPAPPLRARTSSASARPRTELRQELVRTVAVPDVDVLLLQQLRAGAACARGRRAGGRREVGCRKRQCLPHGLPPYDIISHAPEMNHSSSSATPRQNTRFVVSSGSTESRREKRMLRPNLESVPTPVRSSRTTPVARISLRAE